MPHLALIIIKQAEVWPFLKMESSLGMGVLTLRHPVLDFLFLGKMLRNAENIQGTSKYICMPVTSWVGLAPVWLHVCKDHEWFSAGFR